MAQSLVAAIGAGFPVSTQTPIGLGAQTWWSQVAAGRQSAFAGHARPKPQGAEHAPPQSTSASPPFFTPSVHVGVAQPPPAHTPLAQSAGIAQCFPSAQAGHAPPPQSTSV